MGEDPRPNRNLDIRAGKSVRARFTVDAGPSVSPQRIVVPLGTRDMEEARRMRDVAEAALAAQQRILDGYSGEQD